MVRFWRGSRRWSPARAVSFFSVVVVLVGVSPELGQATVAGPTGLAALRNPTNTGPSLTWQTVTGASGYIIYRAGVRVGATTNTAFSDTGLTSDGNYGYSVAAIVAGTPSARSTAVFVLYDTAPPPDVGQPTGVAMMNTPPVISWPKVAWNGGSHGYTYQVSRDGAIIATLPSSASTYTDQSAADGVHSYSVRAVDGAGNPSADWSPILGITLDRAGPPTPVTAVSMGTSGAAAPTVSWTEPVASDPAVAYRIYREGVQVGFTATTSFTDNNVLGTGSYTYTVAAVDALGNPSSPSSPETVQYTVPAGSVWSGVSARMVTTDSAWRHAKTPQLKLISPYFLWRDIEPSYGVFDWATLDAAIIDARTNGYRIIARFAAGADAPEWMRSSTTSGGHPVATLDLLSTAPTDAVNPGEITVPVPWDPNLDYQYRLFVQALNQHLLEFGDASSSWRRADYVEAVPISMPTDVGTEMWITLGPKLASQDSYTGVYKGEFGTYSRTAVNQAEWYANAVGSTDTERLTWLQMQLAAAWMDAVDAHMQLLTAVPSVIAYGGLLGDNQVAAQRIATVDVARYPTRLWSMTTNLEVRIAADGSVRSWASVYPKAAAAIQDALNNGGIVGFQSDAAVTTCQQLAYAIDEGLNTYNMRFFEQPSSVSCPTQLYSGTGNLQDRMAARFGG
jgi:Beta-galactosidase